MTNNNALSSNLVTEKNLTKLSAVMVVIRVCGTFTGWFTGKVNELPRTTSTPQDIHLMTQNGNWMLFNTLDNGQHCKRQR